MEHAIVNSRRPDSRARRSHDVELVKSSAGKTVLYYPNPRPERLDVAFESWTHVPGHVPSLQSQACSGRRGI